jgi:hypothetical protein
MINLIKLVNKFYGGINTEDKMNILEDPDSKFKELDAKSNSRANLFQVLTFGSLNNTLRE